MLVTWHVYIPPGQISKWGSLRIPTHRVRMPSSLDAHLVPTPSLPVVAIKTLATDPSQKTTYHQHRCGPWPPPPPSQDGDSMYDVEQEGMGGQVGGCGCGRGVACWHQNSATSWCWATEHGPCWVAVRRPQIVPLFPSTRRENSMR
jgi:hypothetical protein